ncbi:hypothetical protein QBC41DRAFT_12435 [Cercophora samala]|uniref:Transmembrane protein n=1 Tax=Cercophora samala TaxID=330535 RepID=A0AA39Z760_9PEZI|nr:hypothetical protein QBC41DRAFT_12435 [Cercophora samala]
MERLSKVVKWGSKTVFSLGEEVIVLSSANFPPVDGETTRHFSFFHARRFLFSLVLAFSLFGHGDRNILTSFVDSFLFWMGSPFLLISLGLVCFSLGQFLFDRHFLLLLSLLRLFLLGWLHILDIPPSWALCFGRMVRLNSLVFSCHGHRVRLGIWGMDGKGEWGGGGLMVLKLVMAFVFWLTHSAPLAFSYD